MEGSLVAYKVFTNGSVLNASEINDNLMNQAIIVFSNSTARSAAISSPIEGMITYLQDTAAYESYDGTAWVPFGAGAEPGLNFIRKTNFSAVSSVSLNDIFSADYENYRVIMTTPSSSTNNQLKLRLRVAGADNSTSNYKYGGYDVGSFGGEGARFIGSTTDDFFYAGFSNTSYGSSFEALVSSPFASKATKITSAGAGHRTSVLGGGFQGTTSFTGLTLIANTGNITGSIWVYGLKDS
jgi:hypothetical protein